MTIDRVHFEGFVVKTKGDSGRMLLEVHKAYTSGGRSGGVDRSISGRWGSKDCNLFCRSVLSHRIERSSMAFRNGEMVIEIVLVDMEDAFGQRVIGLF